MMQEYQNRVLKEREDLAEKVARLGVFIDSRKFAEVSGDEQFRLKLQRMAMMQYLIILNDRIDHFPGALEVRGASQPTQTDH